MSWRAGTELFWKFWPMVLAEMPDRDDRLDFMRKILRVFLDNDMDPCIMRGQHPDIDLLMDELEHENKE